MVSESLQPACHQPGSQRPSDQVGPQYGTGELPQQQAQYIAGRGAERLAYADLARAPFDGEGRQAEES